METLRAEKILADVGGLIQDNQTLEGKVKFLQQETVGLKQRVEDLTFQLSSQENYYRGWLRRNVPYVDARTTKEELNEKQRQAGRKTGFFSKVWRKLTYGISPGSWRP